MEEFPARNNLSDREHVFKSGVGLHEIVARSHSCIVNLWYFCCGNCGNLNATVLL